MTYKYYFYIIGMAKQFLFPTNARGGKMMTEEFIHWELLSDLRKEFYYQNSNRNLYNGTSKQKIKLPSI
jgi:hypothetical protein